MSKNERLKQVNIDKIALFLNNKYNKVFKDKNFTIDALKYEISKLLFGKNMKSFKFNENIKKIEKSILKIVSNYGEIKYEPVQMDKINNLLLYNNNANNQQLANTLFQDRNPIKNRQKDFAPKIDEERKNQDNIKPARIQSAIPNVNKLNINNNTNLKKANEIPYPTEKMEKLRERENNKWAIQANKEYEEYLKEKEKLKKDNFEKKLKQRKILEEQIKEKKEYEQKIKQEEKNSQPSITSLKFNEQRNIPNNINKEKENYRRPLSSKPLIKRRKEEIEYQKKLEEDFKKYQEQENMKKKIIRDKYKEIEKENYENAIKKKKEKMDEKEKEKNNKNNENIFGEENKPKELMQKNKLKIEELNKNKINQNLKHQMAINNYENKKYQREIEQEQKKLINDELLQNEKKKKMINEFKKGLDEQIKEKQKLKELNKEAKINENKDNINIKNQIIQEHNLRNQEKYEKINNYKKELDEQIESNKKLKQNVEY